MSVLEDPVLEGDDVVALVRALVPDCHVEGLLVIGLDPDRRVSGVGVNQRHRALSFMKVWELSALATELGAFSLVVVVFPSGACRTPSRHEVDVFVDLCARAHRAGVRLLDCIIMRNEQWWSLGQMWLARSDA
jgi:DNA repair protein RadC